MITAVIVSASLLLAAAFTLTWLLAPSLRREIEEPKHWFHEQAQRYDRTCHAAPDGARTDLNEPS